jgi:hypothetical protein
MIFVTQRYTEVHRATQSFIITPTHYHINICPFVPRGTPSLPFTPPTIRAGFLSHMPTPGWRALRALTRVYQYCALTGRPRFTLYAFLFTFFKKKDRRIATDDIRRKKN